MSSRHRVPPLLLSFVLLVGIFETKTVSARELRDALGTSVRLSDQPSRIVTLAPSLGELVADLLEDDLTKIVGVSEYTDYPPALASVTSIGSYTNFSIEKVISLHPDLVFATTDGNSEAQIDRLRALGVPVVVIKGENFSDFQASIVTLGLALGLEKRGLEMVEQFKRGIENFSVRARLRKPKRVLMQLGDDPMITVGNKSFLNQAITTVGAQNIFGDLDARYPKPSIETVVQRDPDVIVVVELGKDVKVFQRMVEKWQHLPSLKAVKTKQVRLLKADALIRPSLRMLEGLSLLERAIYE